LRFAEQDEPLPERGREPFLLRVGDLPDERLVLPKLRINLAEALYHGGDHRIEDPAVDAEPSRMRDEPPDHAAQDVAAPLVRRLDAVRDQEGGRTSVLRDDLKRGVIPRIVAVRPAG